MATITTGTKATLALALGFAALGAATSVQARGAGPFAGLAGTWSGSGAITMENGSRERVRCRASYAPQEGDAAIRIGLTCASDSYKVQVSGDVQADESGRLSGSWQEATKGVSGDVSGQVAGPGQFQVNLGGTPADIHLNVSSRGRQQNIHIRIDNTDVQAVDVEMRRS